MTTPAPRRRCRAPIAGARGWLATAAVIGTVVGTGAACRRAPAPPSTEAPPASADPADARIAWLPVRGEYVASAALLDLEQKYRAATDPAQKRWALAAAARFGESRAVAWLAEIAATDPKLASAATEAIASVKGDTTALQLADIAMSNGPVAIRTAAIRALAATTGLAQTVQLTVLVADPAQPMKVRRQAAIALGRIRRDEAVSSLARALDETAAAPGTDAEQLRAALIEALGRIDTPETRAVLDRHLQRTLSARERTLTETMRAERN